MPTKNVLVIHETPAATLLLRQVLEQAGAELPLFAGDEASIALTVVDDESLRATEERFRAVVVGALGADAAAKVSLIVTLR